MKKRTTPIYAAIALCVVAADACALGFNSSDLKALSAAFWRSGYAMGGRASENPHDLARAASTAVLITPGDRSSNSVNQVPVQPVAVAAPQQAAASAVPAPGGQPVAPVNPAPVVSRDAPVTVSPVIAPVSSPDMTSSAPPAVATTSAPAAAPQAILPTRWMAPNRMPLRSVLRSWVKDSGWILDWDDDIPELRHSEVTEEWEGDFESAIRGLFQTLPSDAPARAWMDPEKKVLRLAYIKPVTPSGWTVAEAAGTATWSFKSGDKVKAVISDWVKQGSWSMVWDAKAKDIEIGSDAELRGSIEDALQGLSRLLGAGASIRIQADAKSKAVHILPAQGSGRTPARKPILKVMTPKHDA